MPYTAHCPNWQLIMFLFVSSPYTEDAAKSLVHAFVTSRIDYCNCHPRCAHIQPLQYVLNAAARLILIQTWNRSTTTSPATSEIDCTGCPFSSVWSTRSVCWYSSVFTRWHQSTLQWWATRFLPPLAEVISIPQHAAIWRYLDLERRPADKEVFPSLVRHCGTRCRSLFVTHLWQWRSSAHIWRLFCFAEHNVLSIAPSWQFRL